MLLGKKGFVRKGAISVKLDPRTTEQSVGKTRWLFSCYLFNLMRAILFRTTATTVSDASIGIVDESVDHASALAIEGSNLLLSSCIFSYTYNILDWVSNALFWSRTN